MYLILLLNMVFSSFFYNNETYVLDHAYDIKKNIPCENVGEVCYQISKNHYAAFYFVDGVNYEEVHYFLDNIEKRFDKIYKIYSEDTTKHKVKKSEYFVIPNYSFYDRDFMYSVTIEDAPDFIGSDCKVIAISKKVGFF